MQSEIQQALAAIIDQIPLYSEEGGESTQVKVPEVAGSSAIQRVAAGFVEQLFVSLSLLDQELLEQGVWRFVSFPASLMARSVLLTLRDENQRLLPADFWYPQDSMSPASEAQRQLLHAVETYRQNQHAGQAEPIRYVHVAWGIIVVGDRILLRHREDRNRPQLNNYVLCGGRLTQNDLRKAGEQAPLQTLQSPVAAEDLSAMRAALERELEEEAGLLPERDYQAELLRKIKPYKAVEGAGANHALTEYRILVYQVSLTQEGFMRLFERCGQDSELTWFTREELINARSADGKMAFIDALQTDFSTSEDWEHWVGMLPASYAASYLYKDDTQAVTLPSVDDLRQPRGVEIGRTGKESPIDASLSAREAQILIGLAGALPRYHLEAVSGVSVLGHGWVRVDQAELAEEIGTLAKRLSATQCPLIDSYRERYFRLLIAPEQCFLAETHFCYRLDESALCIQRDSVATPLGTLTEALRRVELPSSMLEELQRIAQGDPQRRYQEADLNKLVRRDIRPACQALGLRTLVRTVAKEHVIPVRQAPSAAAS